MFPACPSLPDVIKEEVIGGDFAGGIMKGGGGVVHYSPPLPLGTRPK